MAGLGWVGSYGATGAADALKQMLLDQERQKQVAFDNDLKLRASAREDLHTQNQGKYWDDQIDVRRNAKAASARSGALGKLQALPPNRFVPASDPLMAELQEQGLGGPGFFDRAPATPDTDVDTGPYSVGSPSLSGTLRMPGHEEGFTSIGTQQQNVAGDKQGNVEQAQGLRELVAGQKQTNAEADLERKRLAQEATGREQDTRNELRRLGAENAAGLLAVRERLATVAERNADKPKVRPMPAGEAAKIADMDSALDDLAKLTELLVPANDAGERMPGPTGAGAAWGASIPNWSGITQVTGIGRSAKQTQATIDRVKQVIGKGLEGGVLRKEDEVKYEKILPTIAEDPDVVVSKLLGLDRAIRLNRERTLANFGDAGYDVAAFPEQRVPPLQMPRERGTAAAPSPAAPYPPPPPGGVTGRLQAAPAAGAAPRSPGAAPGRPVIVQTPDGPLQFPNQAEANRFKADVGLP